MDERSTFPASPGHDFFLSNVPEDKYFKSNPEYFCLVKGRRVAPLKGINGQQRFLGHTYAPICTSNGDVKRLCAEGAAAFRRKWEPDCVIQFGMGDNCNVWCECPDCLKLVDKNDPRNNTTRIFKFFNDVARIVYKEFPDAVIHAWAYTGCRDPKPDMKLDPRMYVLWADYGRCYAHRLMDGNCKQNDRARGEFANWLKVSPKTVVRSYLLTCNATYAPLEHVLADDLREYWKRGAAGWVEEVFAPEGDYNPKLLKRDLPSLKHSWMTRWRQLYLAAKLLWNVGADDKALLAEADALHYGKALPVMREYHAYMKKIWEQAPGHSFYGGNIPRAALCLSVPGSEEKLLGLLAKAEKAAEGDAALTAKIRLERGFFERYWVGELKKLREKEQRFAASERLAEPVGIDGVLDEKGWGAAKYPGGMKTSANRRTPPTVVRIAHDSSYWYLAVEAFEPDPGKLKKSCLKKDSYELFEDDTLELFFVSPAAPGKYYQIAVNPAGTLFDAEWLPGMRGNPAFDSKAEYKVSILNDRWQLEIRIPSAPMGTEIFEGAQWKFNVLRSRRVVKPTEDTSLFGIGPHAFEQFPRLIAGKPAIRNGGMDELAVPDRKYPQWNLTSERLPRHWFPNLPKEGAEFGSVLRNGAFDSVLRAKNTSFYQTVLFPADDFKRKKILVMFDAKGEGSFNFAIYRYKGRGGSKFLKAENFAPEKLSSGWKTYSYSFEAPENETIAVAFNASKAELFVDNVNVVEKP